MDVKEILFNLCSIPSISGFEDAMVENLKEIFKDTTDSYIHDNVMSHSFFIKGKTDHNIMLAAHMDEIGLMITDVHEDGFLSFTKIGGVDPFTLIAQEIEIMGKEKIFGIIGVKPPHLSSQDDPNKILTISDLHIDTGYEFDKLKDLVSIGDVAYVKREHVELMGDNISARGLDNKAGIATLALTAKHLKTLNPHNNVYFTATSQEELGYKGATTSSYAIKPDLGIIIDVTFGVTHDVSEDRAIPIGKGPGIAVGSRANRVFTKRLMDTFNKFKHKYTVEVYPSQTGTDAEAIQLANEGVPCVVLSIPLRYMHSSTEVVNVKDIEDLSLMLAMFIKELDDFCWEDVLCD